VSRAQAQLGPPSDEEPVVLLTIRPEPERTFRPHNLILAMPQARRLRDDLHRLLTASTILLLVLSTGCHTRVELESTDAARPGAATSTKTAVQLDFLVDGESEPAAEKTKPAVENESPAAQTSVAVDLFREQGPVLTEDRRPVEAPPEAAIFLGLLV
jgi:hypothetical protein